MRRVIFRPPTISDLDSLAADMRPLDVKECEIVAGLAPREALQEAVNVCENATAVEVEGKVICIFGCSEGSFLGNDGHPWMLSCDGIERYFRVVLTCAPRFFGEMTQTFEHLSNVVHADNHSAIRFLRWCGFSFGDLIEIKGEPFIHFEWRRAEAKAA